MRRVLLPTTLLAVMFGIAAIITPAHAQATRTWVSGVGDDANPCSRTAPCKTFAGAISKTAAGGEINCIDPGGFGGVTITKGITIDCANTEAGVLVAGTNGITVNAGVGGVVTLRGLDLIGTTAVPALNGIVFLSGDSLSVEKCTIREFQAAGANGFGILFTPSAASELYVTDTFIVNNGSGSSGGGIMVRPSGTGSAKVVINRVNVDNNITGITGDGGSSTGAGITLHVRETESSGASFTGISLVTPAVGGSNVGFLLDRSSVLNNVTGVSSFGPKSFAVLTASTISGNTTGINAASSGQMLTFGNNFFTGNNSDGAFTAVPIAPK